MQQIYLDNASTTFPKPQAVADAVYQYITHAGTNISRGTCATTTEDLVFATREQLCRFFGGEDSKNVVFTKNITESLNIIIKGLLHSGDHVLVTAMEHNAVMRPLQQIGTELTTDNAPTDAITFSRIPCDADGALRLRFAAACAPQHQSNHHDARQQCLRHAAALGGNRQLLPKA